MNYNQYQLIEPILSNKTYQTTSLKKASKKCFDEIKNLKINNLETFKIKNLNTNEIFVFKINQPNIQSNKSEKFNKPDQPDQPSENVLNLSHLIDLNQTTQSNCKINDLSKEIKDIKNIVTRIENKIIKNEIANEENCVIS